MRFVYLLLQLIASFDVFEKDLSLGLKVLLQCINDSSLFLVFDQSVFFALSEVHC